MLQIDNHLKPVVLQAGDGFLRHQQVLFRRGLQRHLHIEQARLDHNNRYRNPRLVLQHELHIGPILDAHAAATGAAKQRQLHGSGIHTGQCRGQLAHKLVGAGKTDFSIVHAKTCHALQQLDGVGHGNIDIGLLHPVAQTGVKQLDFSGCVRFHGKDFNPMSVWQERDGMRLQSTPGQDTPSRITAQGWPCGRRTGQIAVTQAGTRARPRQNCG